MKKWLAQNHTKYALTSIACPVLTILFVLSYMTIAYWVFWQENHTPDDAPAVGLMIVGVIFLVFTYTGIASLIGLILAIISVKKQRKLWGISVVALLLNALLIFFCGRAWLHGGY